SNTDGRQHKSRARLELSVSDMASATAKVARRLLDHAATDGPNCLRMSREQRPTGLRLQLQQKFFETSGRRKHLCLREGRPKQSLCLGRAVDKSFVARRLSEC